MSVDTQYHTPRPIGTVPHVPPADRLVHAHKIGIPGELIQLRQWLGYRAIPKPNGKINKPPIDANSDGPGSSTNPSTWGTFDAASRRSPAGAAFVLTPDDPYFALDLDGCVNAETGEITPEAQEIVNRFPIYWEVSFSGTGLRGIGRGVLPKSGCKKGDIETYDQGRYVVMTGRTLPGHETIRNCQRELIAWHNEVWPTKNERPPRPLPTWSGPGLTNEQILEKAFRARNGGKTRRLYDGDTSGYPPSQSDPGFSNEADLALVNLLCGYTQEDDQLADLWRSSRLYRKKLDRNDYVERTIQQARKNQSWAYDPNLGPTPRLTVVPTTPPSDDADPETRSIADLKSELDAACALIAEKDEQIKTLQERIHRQDEREAIQRNKKLGAARATAAVLANLFREEQPRDPDSATAWRVPLAMLSDRTGLSIDASGDHLKLLATYKTPDGIPVLYKETRDIPRTVDRETGEIICEAHKEVWVGPGVDPSEFGALLATLAPNNAPKHGGAADRNRCPDHPDAGVTRHSQNLRRITYKCACCRKVLDSETIPVGRETITHIPSTPDPDPIRHDAGLLDSAPDDSREPAPPPIRHLASSIDNHRERDLSGKMPDSPPPVVDRRSEQDEPPWLWESMADAPSGLPPDWQEENARIYGCLYRGEEVS